MTAFARRWADDDNLEEQSIMSPLRPYTNACGTHDFPDPNVTISAGCEAARATRPRSTGNSPIYPPCDARYMKATRSAVKYIPPKHNKAAPPKGRAAHHSNSNSGAVNSNTNTSNINQHKLALQQQQHNSSSNQAKRQQACSPSTSDSATHSTTSTSSSSRHSTPQQTPLACNSPQEKQSPPVAPQTLTCHPTPCVPQAYANTNQTNSSNYNNNSNNNNNIIAQQQQQPQDPHAHPFQQQLLHPMQQQQQQQQFGTIAPPTVPQQHQQPQQAACYSAAAAIFGSAPSSACPSANNSFSTMPVGNPLPQQQPQQQQQQPQPGTPSDSSMASMGTYMRCVSTTSLTGFQPPPQQLVQAAPQQQQQVVEGVHVALKSDATGTRAFAVLPPPQAVQSHTAKEHPCRDYLRGVCRRGACCRFAHVGKQDDAHAEGEYCRDQLRGVCTRDHCRFIHAPPNAVLTQEVSNGTTTAPPQRNASFASGSSVGSEATAASVTTTGTPYMTPLQQPVQVPYGVPVSVMPPAPATGARPTRNASICSTSSSMLPTLPAAPHMATPPPAPLMAAMPAMTPVVPHSAAHGTPLQQHVQPVCGTVMHHSVQPLQQVQPLQPQQQQQQQQQGPPTPHTSSSVPPSPCMANISFGGVSSVKGGYIHTPYAQDLQPSSASSNGSSQNLLVNNQGQPIMLEGSESSADSPTGEFPYSFYEGTL